MKKKWYQSRILWLNIIGLIATVIELSTGHVVTAAVQESIIGLLTIILRFRTNTGLGK